MVAGGMLPLCMQNSNSVSPSVTVWLSGLVEKEFSNTKRQRQREIHDQMLLFLYAETVSIEEEGREERRRRRRWEGMEFEEGGGRKGKED